MLCDDTQDNCKDKNSIFFDGHSFVEKDGSITEGFNSAEVLKGVHCRVEIEYLTYWLGDKIQEDRPWRSRFSKYIVPSLEYDYHEETKSQIRMDFDDDFCRLVFLIYQ